MKLALIPRSTLKFKSIPQLPGAVLGTTPIVATAGGNNYTVSLNLASLVTTLNGYYQPIGNGLAAVSILDYGAIANNPTTYVTNQTAINAALSTGRPVFFPEGQTFYTQAITIPANAHSMFGRATLIATGAIATSALLVGTGCSNIAIRDLTIQINTATYPSLDAIDLTTCTDPLIENITCNGFNSILTTSCTRPRVRFNRVTDFNNIGIVDRGSTDFECDNNRVTTTNVTTTFYGIQASASDGVDISHNWISNPFKFGIVVSGLDSGAFTPVKTVTVAGNRILNTGREAISIANVTGFAVVGNVCRWTNGSSLDFGISCFGDPNTAPVGTSQMGTISGNLVQASGKAGIALANNCQYVTVSGNTIYDANKLNGGTVYHLAGILVYGHNSNHNKVIGNNVVDPSAHLQWCVNEYDDGIGAGAGPNFNIFGNNTGIGTSGQSNWIGANSGIGEAEFYQRGAGSTTGVSPVVVFKPAMTIEDARLAIVDDVDPTKQGRIDIGTNVATGTIRTMKWLNLDDTFVGLAATQTLTNKTLTAPNIGDATGSSVTLSSSTPFTATGANANFELGAKASANTPFIDFNSSGNSNDFDARMVASGGAVGSGQGTITFALATMLSQGSLVSSSATAGVGYAAGAGGTVTQATSKSTGVTLSKVSGAITMNAAALAAATIVSFVLTNTAIAATDVLVLNHISGGTPGSYTLNARAAAGSATIDVRNNTAGSLSEAIVIQFTVMKGVNA